MLPSNRGYPALPNPTNKTVTSIKLSHPHSHGLVAKCTKFEFYTGLCPNFRIVEKINLMHQRSMGINAMVKHDQISHFTGSKKFSKLHFPAPNEESKMFESGRTGVKCQDFKI